MKYPTFHFQMLSNIHKSISKMFTPTHEWVSISGKIATIGISSYAAHHLGKLTYVDIPIGKFVKVGEEICDIESIKTTSPIISPITGKVIEGNQSVIDKPENVNRSPEKDGWILKMEVDKADNPKLMSEDKYSEFLMNK